MLCFITEEKYQLYFTGQPSTTIPFAVGQNQQNAKSQCSPSVPHQFTPFPSIPTEKYESSNLCEYIRTCLDSQ